MPTSPTQDVAAEVRAEMGRRRLNQRQVADALGVTQGAVWKKLNGRTRFSLSDLQVLADFFGVPVARLLGDDTGGRTATHPGPTHPAPSGPTSPPVPGRTPGRAA